MAAIQRGTSAAVPSSGGESSPLDAAPSGFIPRQRSDDAVSTGWVAYQRPVSQTTAAPVAAPTLTSSTPPPVSAGSSAPGTGGAAIVPPFEINVSGGWAGQPVTTPKAATASVMPAAPAVPWAWLAIGALALVLLARGKR